MIWCEYQKLQLEEFSVEGIMFTIYDFQVSHHFRGSKLLQVPNFYMLR